MWYCTVPLFTIQLYRIYQRCASSSGFSSKLSLVCKCVSLRSLLFNRLPVFLSSLWAVSYAVRLSQSQQCVAGAGEKEKRPSGLGHTVAATTRDAARTPLQTIITVRLRNNDNGYGNVSPLCLQWCSLFPLTPPMPSSPHSLPPHISADLTLSSHLLR